MFLIAAVVSILPCVTRLPQPPSIADIQEEVAIARSLLNGLSMAYTIEDRGYVEAVESGDIRTMHRQLTMSWADGQRRWEHWNYGYEIPGQGPSRRSVAFFDGRDSFRILTPTGRETQPGLPVVAKSGFTVDSFPLHPTANFESLVFGGLSVHGLDALLADSTWTAVVAPTTERVNGQDCWKLELRQTGRSSVLTYWLGQDVGFMPVMSTVYLQDHLEGRQPTFVNGTIASNFEEVRPGLWLPGVVRITDPNDPNPETYIQFTRESIRAIDEGENLCPELASGAVDMIDLRTGERYLMLDGERGPSTPISDAKQIERSLDQLLDHGRVLAAKTPTTKPTGSPVLLVVGMSVALALAACWWCIRIFRK